MVFSNEEQPQVEQQHMVATIESVMFTGHGLVKVSFA
jgi:hypothetical protein